MRVALYLFRLDVPQPTGVQRYAVELTRALVTATDKSAEVQLWAGKNSTVASSESDAALTVHHPSVNRRLLHLSWTLVKFPRFEWVAGSFDVVHSLNPTIVLPARSARVITIHDLLPWQHPEWYARGPAWRFRRSVVDAARSGAEIIVPSSYVASVVRNELRIADSRMHVIPEGVSGRFAEPADEAAAAGLLDSLGLATKGYVLALGQLTERKNLAVVAAAVRRLGGSLPLVIAGGDGPGAEAVRSSVAIAGGSLARFIGHRTDDEVATLLQHAAAFVFPSVSEGFGLPPLEAMAAGTPVIAADATSLPEVVRDAGLLADPHDEADWANQLQRLLDEPTLRDDLRRRGKERAAELTWSRAAQATWDVYRLAARRRGVAP